MQRIGGILGLLCWCLLTTVSTAAQEAKALRRIVVAEQRTAQDIMKQLQQGVSFSALARARSIAPEARTGGYVGTVRPQDLQPALRNALLKLQDGQISDVFESEGQFVIIKAISPQIGQHFEAADRAEEAGQFPQAIQELQAALRLEGDNVQAYIKLGLLQQSARQFAEAVRTLEQVQQYMPQDVQITLLLASAYTHAATEGKNAAQAEKAIEEFEKALRQDARYAPAINFGLGKVYLMALGQPDRALRHLAKAAEATENVPEVHYLLIKAYYETRRYDQAWQQMRRAQTLGFEFPALLQALQKAKPQSQR